MAHKADVVVIGGGIVGTACAYFLTEAGAKVIILERDALGSGASGHGAGAFGVPLHWIEPPFHADFMRRAVRFLKYVVPDVAEQAGIDILMREMPWMEIARSQPTWDYMLEWGPTSGQVMLTPEDIRRIEPRLSGPILGGMIDEAAGQLDAYRTTLAYAKAAENRGAEVVIGEATALMQSGGKITGVESSIGAIECDGAVLAMGAWTGKAKEWTEFPLEISAMKGEILTLRKPDEDYWPYWVASYETSDNGEELPIYLHRRANGLIYAGTTAEPDIFDNIPTAAARQGILERASRMMPFIEDAELVEHLAGPRPNPADGITVLGGVPGWEGLFAAVTLPGILCSAYLGKIIADLVFDRPLPTDIEKLKPDRFTQPLTTQYGYHKLVADRGI